MDKEVKKIKNLKIDEDVHNVLKKYCDKRGIKMYKFLENLILTFIVKPPNHIF